MVKKDANADEFDSSNHVVFNTPNKYQNISNKDSERIKGFIESLPFQLNLLSDNPLILVQEDRVKAAYSIFTDTIIRNLPDIDPNIAKVLVHATIEEILPLVFKTSEEIKHRYQDTGKFEGYEHPEIKEIIEKHLLSNHRKSQSILVKLTKIFGTPIHEIFGKQKYAEGEPAMVAKNVHTSISRSGNIVAGCLFIEGMSAVTNPILSVISAVLLYTGLQVLNEYTNEVEHSTVDKRKFMKKFTKWTTILSAKSIPIIMTALSVAALETSNLQERYMKLEGEKLYAEITKRAQRVEESPSRQQQEKDRMGLEEKVRQLKAKREEAREKTSKDSYHSITRELTGFSNGNSVPDETAAMPKLEALEKTIKEENEIIKTLQKKYDDNWIKLGQVGFFQEYADVFLGENSKAGKEFKRKVQKYNDLPAGTRFENGLGHMGEVLLKLKFNDEILLRIWVAILFESLSIITLLAVQSRMDFTKVITNSDTQISLGHVVEGAIAFNRQIASITDYNEFRSEEDARLSSTNKASNSNDSTRFKAESEKHTKNHDTSVSNSSTKSLDKLWNYFIARPIDKITADKEKYRDEPPSYSSLVNSVSIQKAIAELFREGHILAFNQIVGDISRGLIHPIPLDTEAISRLKKAKEIKIKANNEKEEALVELFKHDEKLEGDTRYLLNIPRKMVRALQENILSNDKSSLSTESLAINLSRIILNETPAKETNHSLLLDELYKEDKKESYLKLLIALQDLNSDIQDVIDNYGATKDRLDLKNKFKDKVRSIIKEFETGEKYSGVDEMALIDLAKIFENKETNLNINYIRTDMAISYIKELTSQRQITPVLLNQIVQGLKTGSAVTISASSKNKVLFLKIKDLRLASPYQKSIATCIYKMQNLSTEFMGSRIGWLIGRKKANDFKMELKEIILVYESESFQERSKNYQPGT